MIEDCAELRKQLHEHKEKFINHFNDAERLRKAALRMPASRRGEMMSEVFAQQTKGNEEVQIIEQIKRKLKENDCADTEDQSSNLPNDETPENLI